MSAPIGNEVVELAAVVVGLHITDKVQTPLSTVMLVDLVWPGNNPDKPERRGPYHLTQPNPRQMHPSIYSAMLLHRYA